MMSQRILVFEDSATELAVIVGALRSSGFEVMTAGDGEQALTMMGATSPDLVVLDIILPKSNGYTVCRKLKQKPEWKHIPVVMLSSKDQESDVYWGKKQGADAYLTKPFVPQELVAQVRSLL
jgi:twitching motility two-component system response regulator PilH